jgi:hypothetical protein
MPISHFIHICIKNTQNWGRRQPLFKISHIYTDFQAIFEYRFQLHFTLVYTLT